MPGMFRRRLPPETLARLPAYRHELKALEAAGEHVVSSKELASRLQVSDAQLRRDLSYLALLGRPGLGYEVGTLLNVISEVLGLDRRWSLAVIGAGSLGTALAKYTGFADSQMALVGVFDTSPEVIGKQIGAIAVSSMETLGEVATKQPIDIAILTVPADQAQRVLDMVATAGVRAVLSFSPVALSAPPGVIVRYVDISSELQQLTYMLTQQAVAEAP